MRVCHMLVVLAVGASLPIQGCASQPGAYSRREAGQVQMVREGEVVMVREVTIEGTGSGVGSIAGGVMGYAVGKSLFKSGSARHVARAGTTVGGAAAGAAVARKATTQQGIEITVELDKGGVVSVVQPAEPGREFRVGDEVKVLVRPDGSARVIQ